MLANYLIGLREGLEASLVVSILATFLVKSGHRDRLKLVWIGVASALAVAAVAWGLLQFVTALTAKSFTSPGDHRRGDVDHRGRLRHLDDLLDAQGVPQHRRRAARADRRRPSRSAARAVVILAFLAVGREGLETALFVYAAAQATATTGRNAAARRRCSASRPRCCSAR